jgi:hypothetical protein
LPLPAGIGDVLTGVLVIPAAIHVARQGRYWRGVGIAWNVLGIADLIIALAIGFVTLESGGRPPSPVTG